MMRIVMNIIAGFMLLVGAIWAFQGAGILPGSVMSGDSFWLYTGLIMIVIGVVLLLYQNRQKPDSAEN
jgi:hypothetical protein